MNTPVLSGRWRLGLLLTLNTCFWWSILPITLTGVMHKMDPLTVTFYRYFFAVIVLWPVLLLKPSAMAGLQAIRRPSVLKNILLASLLLAMNYGLYILAVQRMSPAGAQLLIQLAPMLFCYQGCICLMKSSFVCNGWAYAPSLLACCYFFICV